MGSSFLAQVDNREKRNELTCVLAQFFSESRDIKKKVVQGLVTSE